MPTKPTTESADVVTAILAVMRDVRGIAKDQLHKGGGTTFRFRGVDDCVNALGPAMRTHGLLLVPQVLTVERRDFPSKAGGTMRESVVTVAWHVYGPDGSTLPEPIITAGESADSGDKGLTKAQSVAWRVAMIQLFALPTDEPDPDHDSYDRGGYTDAPRSNGNGSSNGSSRPAPPQEPVNEDALGELVALVTERDWDPKIAALAFHATYHHPANEGTAEELRAFVADLRAEPERVLALGVPQ